MDNNSLGIIELAIFGSIALGWAFRELWLLRQPPKAKRSDEGDGRNSDREA